MEDISWKKQFLFEKLILVDPQKIRNCLQLEEFTDLSLPKMGIQIPEIEHSLKKSFRQGIHSKMAWLYSKSLAFLYLVTAQQLISINLFDQFDIYIQKALVVINGNRECKHLNSGRLKFDYKLIQLYVKILQSQKYCQFGDVQQGINLIYDHRFNLVKLEPFQEIREILLNIQHAMGNLSYKIQDYDKSIYLYKNCLRLAFELRNSVFIKTFLKSSQPKLSPELNKLKALLGLLPKPVAYFLDKKLQKIQQKILHKIEIDVSPPKKQTFVSQRNLPTPQIQSQHSSRPKTPLNLGNLVNTYRQTITPRIQKTPRNSVQISTRNFQIQEDYRKKKVVKKQIVQYEKPEQSEDLEESFVQTDLVYKSLQDILKYNQKTYHQGHKIWDKINQNMLLFQNHHRSSMESVGVKSMQSIQIQNEEQTLNKQPSIIKVIQMNFIYNFQSLSRSMYKKETQLSKIGVKMRFQLKILAKRARIKCKFDENENQKGTIQKFMEDELTYDNRKKKRRSKSLDTNFEIKVFRKSIDHIHVNSSKHFTKLKRESSFIDFKQSASINKFTNIYDLQSHHHMLDLNKTVKKQQVVIIQNILQKNQDYEYFKGFWTNNQQIKDVKFSKFTFLETLKIFSIKQKFINRFTFEVCNIKLAADYTIDFHMLLKFGTNVQPMHFTVNEHDILINHPFSEKFKYVTIWPLMYPKILKYYMMVTNQTYETIYKGFPQDDAMVIDSKTAILNKICRLDNHYVEKTKHLLNILTNRLSHNKCMKKKPYPNPILHYLLYINEKLFKDMRREIMEKQTKIPLKKTFLYEAQCIFNFKLQKNKFILHTILDKEILSASLVEKNANIRYLDMNFALQLKGKNNTIDLNFDIQERHFRTFMAQGYWGTGLKQRLISFIKSQVKATPDGIRLINTKSKGDLFYECHKEFKKLKQKAKGQEEEQKAQNQFFELYHNNIQKLSQDTGPSTKIINEFRVQQINKSRKDDHQLDNLKSVKVTYGYHQYKEDKKHFFIKQNSENIKMKIEEEHILFYWPGKQQTQRLENTASSIVTNIQKLPSEALQNQEILKLFKKESLKVGFRYTSLKEAKMGAQSNQNVKLTSNPTLIKSHLILKSQFLEQFFQKQIFHFIQALPNHQKYLISTHFYQHTDCSYLCIEVMDKDSHVKIQKLIFSHQDIASLDVTFEKDLIQTFRKIVKKITFQRQFLYRGIYLQQNNRYLRNFFSINNLALNHYSNKFLEQQLRDSDVVNQYTYKINQKFGILTVSKIINKEVWRLKLYFPSSSRNYLCYLDYLPDFSENHLFVRSNKLYFDNYKMKEVLHQSCVSIDQFNYYFQISLKNTQEKIDLSKQFEGIQYQFMENYDFYIKYYTFNGPIKQAKKINLREIINLFIAEGLYKYQTNYMNSKVNQSDFESICNFIVYKIKTSNYANFLKDIHLKKKESNTNKFYFI